MAERQDIKLDDRRGNLEKNVNFEHMVKERMDWSSQKWIDMGENDSKLKKLTNSMRYWRVKLAKAQGENNVIIGLYNEHRNVSLSLTDVIDQLIVLNVSENLIGYNFFRNPRYINFTFDSQVAKQFVLKNLKRIAESEVVFLEWASSAKEAIVKTHWVPADLEVESIKPVLLKYGEIKNITREVHKLMNGKEIANGTITFKVDLKPNVELKDLPYFCDVNGLELLVNVTGRPILCLNCGLYGHKSSECNTPFCSGCKKMQEKIHECIVKVEGGNMHTQADNGSASATGVTIKLMEEKGNINAKDGLTDIETKSKVLYSQNMPIFEGNKVHDLIEDAMSVDINNKVNTKGDVNSYTDDEFSDESINEMEQDVDTKMLQYAVELENLKKESLLGLGSMVSLKTEQKQDSKIYEAETKMDLDSTQLKRKFSQNSLSKSVETSSFRDDEFRVLQTSGNNIRKTYSKRGGSRGGGASGGQRSDILFQQIEDHQHGKLVNKDLTQ